MFLARILFALLACCAGLSAQDLTFSIHDLSGANPNVPFPANYAFPATPQSSSSSVNVQVKNSGSFEVELILAYVGNSPDSPAATQDFSVTGLPQGNIIAPGDALDFDLNFIPTSTGNLTGYLQAAYLVPQNGCTLSARNCPTTVVSVSTLTGTATAPQLVLSYSSAGQGNTVLQPARTQRLDFGNVSVSAAATFTFTLANQSSSDVTTPAVSLQNEIYNSSAFALDTKQLPASIPAGGSGTFTITFAPGQTGFTSTVLVVGSNQYGLQGTGIITADTDALQISYVDATGVRSSPQAATPISFGQIVPGANASSTLRFTVTNPATSFSAVTLPSLAVAGSAFALSGAPAMPAAIQPGASITFSIAFSALTSGTSTGTLTLANRTFALTGLAVISPVPSLSIVLSQSVLTSQQQATLQVQFSAAAASSNYGELSMQFTPAVANVTDDPAIVFLASGGRQLQINVAAGAQTATYSSQEAIAFQTGTTAGTLTFTVTFPNTAPYSKSFTITPAQIFLSSAVALRQSPNLVITLNGYDNTYSAGKMNFTFYDLKGNAIGSALAVDASTNFQQYFFDNNKAGGAFAVQATFPVTGDATQIGSVAVSLANSVGNTSDKLTFQ